YELPHALSSDPLRKYSNAMRKTKTKNAPAAVPASTNVTVWMRPVSNRLMKLSTNQTGTNTISASVTPKIALNTAARNVASLAATLRILRSVTATVAGSGSLSARLHRAKLKKLND